MKLDGILYRGWTADLGCPARYNGRGQWVPDKDLITVKLYRPGSQPDFDKPAEYLRYYFRTRADIKTNVRKVINKLIRENRHTLE